MKHGDFNKWLLWLHKSYVWKLCSNCLMWACHTLKKGSLDVSRMILGRIAQGQFWSQHEFEITLINTRVCLVSFMTSWYILGGQRAANHHGVFLPRFYKGLSEVNLISVFAYINCIFHFVLCRCGGHDKLVYSLKSIMIL